METPALVLTNRLSAPPTQKTTQMDSTQVLLGGVEATRLLKSAGVHPGVTTMVVVGEPLLENKP